MAGRKPSVNRCLLVKSIHRNIPIALETRSVSKRSENILSELRTMFFALEFDNLNPDTVKLSLKVCNLFSYSYFLLPTLRQLTAKAVMEHIHSADCRPDMITVRGPSGLLDHMRAHARLVFE